MKLEHGYSSTRADDVNPLDTSVSASRRRWTTFLQPGPARGGKCSWRRHFVGVPAAIIGYLQSLAARDAERFAYPSISTISRKAIPGRKISRCYTREVLDELQRRMWVESRTHIRHGRPQKGWTVRNHDGWVATECSPDGHKVVACCPLSVHQVDTKCSPKEAKNHPQSLDGKGDSSDGGGSESSIEPSNEPASELIESARLLLARIGFDGKITSPKLLKEIGKLAQAKWTRKKDGMKLGIDEVPESKVAGHLTRWRDRCNSKGRKLPVELLEAIEYFDNSSNVLDASKLLPEDW